MKESALLPDWSYQTLLYPYMHARPDAAPQAAPVRSEMKG